MLRGKRGGFLIDYAKDLMDLKALEMAKKRDHKILITDEAIKRVPFIRYKEIPEEEYPIIQMLAQKVLQLSKDENGSNEVAITYSMDNPEDEREAKQCFGIDFGDNHSADPMRDSYSYHLYLHKAISLKALQKTSEHFLKNCYKAGIVYEDK